MEIPTEWESVMSDDNWIDISSVNSRFEVQTNTRTGQYRHRPIAAKMPRNRMMGADRIQDQYSQYYNPDVPWQPGKPVGDRK